MNNERMSLIVSDLLMTMKIDLAAKKEIGQVFHIFFEDGYCLFDCRTFSKEKAYGYLNVFLRDPGTKSIAYSVTSDCYMRSPETMEIIGEQLIALLVTADGSMDVTMQPYKRETNGKIKYDDPIPVDNTQAGGPITEFYQPGLMVSDEMRKQVIQEIRERILRKKIPYSTYAKETESPAFD